jgi:putative ABC transport system permease protein
MLKNYLSIALRNIRNNPLYAFINIFSLAIGLTACIVIYLFIRDERSFDDFHSKKDNIYRLDEVQNFTGTNLQKVALSMPGMAPALQQEFPDVITYTRYWNRGKQLIEAGDQKLLIENPVMVDSTFLKIFDYKILMGDRSTALDEPYSIVVSEETAIKFFGEVSKALDNTLKIRDKEHKITGIIENVPENSHLKFDVLISMTTITREDAKFNDRWGSNYVNTYLLLKPDADTKKLEAEFPAFLRRHMDDPDINKYYVLFLQRLDQVHLASTDIEHDYNNYRKFNGKYLDVFAMIGVFILLIASVNFMNLTTARSSHRGKEIGVRKTVGAKKGQLFFQFIFESILLASFALVFAILLTIAFVPLLNELIGRKLSVLDLVIHYESIFWLLALALGLGVITGIYPSLYLTSFTLSRVLKGATRSEGKSIFRSSLVVVQFGLALAMIVSTLVVIQQLSFMKNADIGFEKEQMMIIDMNKEVNEKFETLKTELLKSKLVQGVTASGQRLGNNFHQWGFKVKADTGVVNLTPSNVNVDYDYLDVYGIKLKDGRSFSRDNIRDNGFAFIINEALAKEIGLKEPVGTKAGHSWYHNDSLGTIVGVTENFNFNSLHHKINTLSIVVHPDWGYDEMSVKIDSKNASEAIAFVKDTWDRLITTYPFSYTFLDEHFDQLYRSDEQMSSVVTIMASLAILISCMGLFGLSAITTERRTKEIGIRKVLGASESQITVLLSRNFTILIVISFLLSAPITYGLLDRWLNSFAYRVGINPFMFLLGAIIALIIAISTISYHTLRSARANPVKALRYE